MAFMNQERKKTLAAALKVAMAGSGLTYTLRVHHHSTIIMQIHSGPVDFIKNAQAVAAQRPRPGFNPLTPQPPLTHFQVNEFWIHEHFTGRAKTILLAAKAALSIGNHDRSDIQSDYFDVGWYVNINVGSWNKPYKLVK